MFIHHVHIAAFFLRQRILASYLNLPGRSQRSWTIMVRWIHGRQGFPLPRTCLKNRTSIAYLSYEILCMWVSTGAADDVLLLVAISTTNHFEARRTEHEATPTANNRAGLHLPYRNVQPRVHNPVGVMYSWYNQSAESRHMCTTRQRSSFCSTAWPKVKFVYAAFLRLGQTNVRNSSSLRRRVFKKRRNFQRNSLCETSPLCNYHS